ncbi:SIS domain-containing protein [Streptomyces sp. DSM 44917]|uniref:SIS domain-containing protein n=1 Tax=Streptomyces boetiae TaxID=3075541 RepID=A0ABU2LBE3_9ACTN|nr:SIS domain-containing protein [Streptomyces sp. DSM 44917]MDT0308890.1 SIS domain-containing protein [Streptomyces sp. DSM 44917]
MHEAPGAPRSSRSAREHCRSLQDALRRLCDQGIDEIVAWGRELAHVLPSGGRLLAAGNGGSAAQAQHLTAEMVGRYAEDRRPYSAISLHAETSSVTAIGNDYGFDEVFARQVAAHGRAGDVLILMSTSGRSDNLLGAATAGRAAGLRVWAMTGPRPNPLAAQADAVLAIDAPTAATVQEAHLVALHVLCEVFDETLSGSSAAAPPAAVPRDGSLARGRAVLTRREVS